MIKELDYKLENKQLIYEKYSDDSNRHFIQVLKQWRDLEK